jgi:hypothetical protein
MAAPHPVRVRVLDDELARSRWSVFFRLLLALPHLFVLGVFAMIGALLLPILWIVTLIRATPPNGLAEFYARLIVYGVHVQAYVHLAAARFPPFLGQGDYELAVELPLPERQNRWTIAFRGILAIPALLLAAALGSGIGAGSASWLAYYNIGVLPAVAFLAWFACLVRGRMPRGFRDLLLLALAYGVRTYAYLFFITGRYPNSDPESLVPDAQRGDHPVTLGVAEDDLRRSRMLVFFRLPLAFPHLVWLVLWSVLALLAGIAAWFSALVLGRVPGALHRFLAAWVRYTTHVSAFLYLAGNPFPGFAGATGRYPIELEVPGPERQSRWTIGFRMLLASPAAVVSSALGTVLLVAGVMAWFASLFTARMPPGLRNLIAYSLRYGAQYYAYVLLLTPRYPYSGPGPLELPPAQAPRNLAEEAFG